MKRDLIVFLGPVLVGGIAFAILGNLIWLLFKTDAAMPMAIFGGLVSAGVAFIVLNNLFPKQKK